MKVHVTLTNKDQFRDHQLFDKIYKIQRPKQKSAENVLSKLVNFTFDYDFGFLFFFIVFDI